MRTVGQYLFDLRHGQAPTRLRSHRSSEYHIVGCYSFHRYTKVETCRRSKRPSGLGRRQLTCLAHGAHGQKRDNTGHSCCGTLIDHSHGHHDDANAVVKVVRRMLGSLGLLKVASYLEHDKLCAIAKISFFAAASLLQWSYSSSYNTCNVMVDQQKTANLCTMAVYFLAGIPAAISLLLDILSLKIDTHVLMNLAVIGTLVAGLPLEGALLLVLFQTSHAVEHMLTDRAQGSLEALFDSIPDHADLLQMKDDGSPDLSSIRNLPVDKVDIGDVMLVKPGSQVCKSFFSVNSCIDIK